jgi:hypothetical protein
MTKEKLREAQKEIRDRIKSQKYQTRINTSEYSKIEIQLERQYQKAASRLEALSKRRRTRRNEEISKDLN